MKCPLMIANVPLAMSEENPAVGDCLEEGCAWWSLNDKFCVIKALYCHLADIDKSLKAISEKMPTELQFRK